MNKFVKLNNKEIAVVSGGNIKDALIKNTITGITYGLIIASLPYTTPLILKAAETSAIIGITVGIYTTKKAFYAAAYGYCLANHEYDGIINGLRECVDIAQETTDIYYPL